MDTNIDTNIERIQNMEPKFPFPPLIDISIIAILKIFVLDENVLLDYDYVYKYASKISTFKETGLQKIITMIYNSKKLENSTKKNRTIQRNGQTMDIISNMDLMDTKSWYPIAFEMETYYVCAYHSSVQASYQRPRAKVVLDESYFRYCYSDDLYTPNYRIEKHELEEIENLEESFPSIY
jgi:hypothetical protein